MAGSRPDLVLACSSIAQMLGISGAVVMAAIDIETIVGTGPLLSLIGLALGITGWARRRSMAILVFGLATGVFSLTIFLLIFILEWSPSEARGPVPRILVGYQVVLVSIGLVALHRLLHLPDVARPRFQFGLRSMLSATFIAGVSLAAMRLTMPLRSMILSVAIGLFVATTLSIALLVVRSYHTRPMPENTSP